MNTSKRCLGNCGKKECGNCLVCSCKCRSKFNTAKDRRRRYLRDVAVGRFVGTWNEYQAMCKKIRYGEI